jgi:hypothetical protein
VLSGVRLLIGFLLVLGTDQQSDFSGLVAAKGIYLQLELEHLSDLSTDI